MWHLRSFVRTVFFLFVISFAQGEIVAQPNQSFPREAEFLQSLRCEVRQETHYQHRDNEFALGSSCNHINCEDLFVDSGGSAQSGFYDICPDGNTRIRAYCEMTSSEGWTIIDPSVECKWNTFFSSWEGLAGGSVRGISDSFESWRNWFWLADHNSEFALSPNCRVVGNRDQVYRITGNYYGCYWYNRNCDFNGSCQLCLDDNGDTSLGTCLWIEDGVGGAQGEFSPDYTYPFDCTFDWWNSAPSIGARGHHCVGYYQPHPMEVIAPGEFTTGQLGAIEVTFNGVAVDANEIAWQSMNSTVVQPGHNQTDTLFFGGGAGSTVLIGEHQGQTGRVLIEVHRLEIEGNYEITPGETNQLVAKLDGIQLDPALVTWQSLSPAEGMIGADGIVTALAVGDINISASFGEQRAELAITSQEFRLAGDSTIDEGEVSDTDPIVLGEAVDPSTVTLQCDNPTVVQCNTDGTIEGLAEGTATVTATALTKTAKKKVAVKCDKKEQRRRIVAKLLARYITDATSLIAGEPGGKNFDGYVPPSVPRNEPAVYAHLLGEMRTLRVSSTIPRILQAYEKRVFKFSNMHNGTYVKRKNPSVADLNGEMNKTIATDLHVMGEDPPGHPHHRYPATGIQDRYGHWYWLKEVNPPDHFTAWDPCTDMEIIYTYDASTKKYHDPAGKERVFKFVEGAWVFPK